VAQPERAVLVRHPVAMAGIAITTASAIVFIALAVAMFVGLLDNPYAGLVVFVGLPAVFIMGLVLIPWGMRLQRRAIARGEGEADWPVVDFRQSRTRRVALAIASLTAINLIIMLVAGYGTLHWMESPQFCGQVCHEPMHPQFTAWQNSPHSNITCVQCHIGEGGEAFVHYKTAGMRQLFHVVTNSYPRPIPGVADMRPALETCGNCHWPGRSIGDRVRVLNPGPGIRKKGSNICTVPMTLTTSWYTSTGRINGRVIEVSTWRGVRPRERAASSMPGGTCRRAVRWELVAWDKKRMV